MHRADQGFFQKFRASETVREIRAPRILAAVSGGADSVAMLHCLWRLAREKRWDVRVAHIQHGLRGRASLQDQAFVESFAEKLHLKFHVEKIPVKAFAKQNKLGLEEAGRMLRYRALSSLAKRLSAPVIAVAHNANDQAETVLINILRGTGLDGLSGILPRRALSEITGSRRDQELELVRPFLGFTRREILAYLRSQKLAYRKDSTNDSLEFTRNWVRHKLLPLMEKAQPRIHQNLGRLSLYSRAERKLKETAFTEASKDLVSHDGKSLDLEGLFRYDISKRFDFLHRLLPGLSHQKIESVHAALEQKKSSQLFFPIPTLFSKFINRFEKSGGIKKKRLAEAVS